jgi:hypothetical protein
VSAAARVWIPLDQYFRLHQETEEARGAAELVRNDELARDVLGEQISRLLKVPVEGTPAGQFVSIRLSPGQIHSITAVDIPNRALTVVGDRRFECVAVCALAIKKPPPSEAALREAIKKIMQREGGKGRPAIQGRVIEELCEGEFYKHNQAAVAAGVRKNWKQCSIDLTLDLHDPGRRPTNPARNTRENLSEGVFSQNDTDNCSPAGSLSVLEDSDGGISKIPTRK